MRSTMQDVELSVGAILKYGVSSYPNSKVFTYLGDQVEVHTFKEVGQRAAQLAHCLEDLGVGESDRVGTFCFNHHQHLEAYFAISCMGAVLHTLNIRLFEEQLKFVINDGQDRVVIVDSIVLPILAKVLPSTPCVEAILVIGELPPKGMIDESKMQVLSYEEKIATQPTRFDWPEVDEHSAASMCHTSGTTGNPKGVVYSHRSTWLHAASIISGNCLDIRDVDSILVVVPMFHANAWGMPYEAFLTGADLVLPFRFLQGEPLAKIISELKPTITMGVPSIWNDLLHYASANRSDLSSLRIIGSGGSAAPRSLIEGYEREFSIPMIQGWGMTETSPVCTLSFPPRYAPKERRIDYQVTQGRAVPGVEMRIVGSQGEVLPEDGTSIGEIEVRGPWVTSSYYNVESSESFQDGWLRTGDMGTVDDEGYLRLVDRTKDVIKSGGEWISSVELENTIMGHPDVFEAAVVAVEDEKWGERPLAVVVAKPGATLGAEDLKEFLRPLVVKWWLPERWAFLEAIPKTSVGKFDKRTIRSMYLDEKIEVIFVR